MQTLTSLDTNTQWSRAGGRVGSEAYRHSLELCESFAGLKQDTHRYELLLLVKKVGKDAGFTPRMIRLLEYYIAYTRDHDWEQGGRPIVYQSLARTALDLGVSERQVQRLENQLFEAGAVTWHASGNHKRYGSRDPVTDKIVFAYGVDLTPLAYLKPDLELKHAEKQQAAREWIETRRRVSWYRGQVRSLILELREEGACPELIHSLEKEYDGISYQLRTHIKLDAMRDILAEHERLHGRVLEAVEALEADREEEGANRVDSIKATGKESPRSDLNVAHYQQINLPKKRNRSPAGIGFQESVVELREPEREAMAPELEHVSLQQLLLVASDRFRAYLPLEELGSRTLSDFVDAAYRLRADMFISQSNWSEACRVLGVTAAAVCVLVTDRARDRADNPVVRPAAYFRELIKRARRGELRLQSSVYGLLEEHVAASTLLQ